MAIRGQSMIELEHRLDRPAPKGEGSGYHSLEDFDFKQLKKLSKDRWFMFTLRQYPKRQAHVAAMKAKGIWPKDLEDECILPAQDVE